MRQITSTAAAALVLLVTAGCGTAKGESPGGDGADTFGQRATEVAEAWQGSPALAAWRTGFRPLQPLTVEPDWSGHNSLAYAFTNGWRRVVVDLPRGAAEGMIEYPGGATQRVSLVTAAQALRLAMPQRTSFCGDQPPGSDPLPRPTPEPLPPLPETPLPETRPPATPLLAPSDSATSTVVTPPHCEDIVITRARAMTTTLVTSRGTATVPAWEFTIRGLPDPLVRVAIAPQDIDDQPSAAPALPAGPAGLVVTQGIEGASDRRLSFVIGVGACDIAVQARAHETEDVVVVGGTTTSPGPGTACPAILKLQPATVTLAAPVGDRLVVDAATGRPPAPPPIG